MAPDAANDINHYLLVNAQHKDHLAPLRSWSRLKLAFDGPDIWVSNLNYAQVQSTEVKTIPYKTLFYEKNGQLFLLNSLLPHRNMPALLWTPIDRALPIALPAFNHNYFGLGEDVAVTLVPSAVEREGKALLVELRQLYQYLETAPAIRLQPLQWAIINHHQAFITGRPLLPVPGAALWNHHQFFLPAGYEFDLHLLVPALNRLVNADGQNWVIWNTDGSCMLVPKSAMQPLSLSACRQAIHLLTNAPAS